MREALTEQEIDTMTANVRSVFNTEWDFVNNPEHIELAFSEFESLLEYVHVVKIYKSAYEKTASFEEKNKAVKSILIQCSYKKKGARYPSR